MVNLLHCDPDEIVLSQLKATGSNCYNNVNYKATTSEESYFIKFSNKNSLFFNPLKNEFYCTKLAYEAGIAPNPLIYDEERSLMVSKFIETKISFDFANVAEKKRYTSLLQKLHKSEIFFPIEFSPFEAMQACIKTAQEKMIILPDDLLKEVLPKIMSLSEKELFINKAPCHLDAHLENLLDDGESLYLIDWECAGMCDPWFDLASVSALEDFSDEEMYEILELYLEQVPADEDFDKLFQMRIIADARFCFYCFLQSEGSSERANIYKKVAKKYLKQCQERLKILSNSRGFCKANGIVENATGI
jgi:thiamine kinase-like enzyme